MPRKTDRRHQRGDESRRRILEATLEIAAERGYEGTSVGLVTERTGLPASSIYWHFRNKDQLLAETLEYSYRRWRATAPTWTNDIEPVGLDEQIHRRLHRAATAITESPEFWRLGLMLALEKRVVEPAARQRFLTLRRETEDAIVTWWTKILPDETIAREELARRLARFHLAVMDGLFIGARTHRGWDRAALVDMVATGLHAHVGAVAARR